MRISPWTGVVAGRRDLDVAFAGIAEHAILRHGAVARYSTHDAFSPEVLRIQGTVHLALQGISHALHDDGVGARPSPVCRPSLTTPPPIVGGRANARGGRRRSRRPRPHGFPHRFHMLSLVWVLAVGA